jgi:hypothetical protein
MSPFDREAFSGRSLSFHEREEIALLRATGTGVRAIARTLGRSPSTVSRELRRNAATRGGRLEYRAQWKAELVARRPKDAKFVTNPFLRGYVQERLSGKIQRPDGTPVTGPAAGSWTGRNKPHRKDRAWVQAWSPDQIANRIKIDFPDDESMRVGHEAIYQALYIQGRGALKRELALCLCTGRALRAPRARSRRKTWAHVTSQALISERPADLPRRPLPDHRGRRVRHRRLCRLVQPAAAPRQSWDDDPGRVRRRLLRDSQPRAATRIRSAENRGRFIATGKTHGDVRRSLKRALARRLYRLIETAVRLHEAAVVA